MHVTWREAVKEVCEASGVSQATLAKKAGLYPMALSRLLQKRNAGDFSAADAKQVPAVNRAAALLTGVPQIEAYLNAVGGLEGLLGPHGSVEADGSFLVELVEEFDPYFEGGAERTILEAVAPLDRSARWQIVRRCAAARGRELVRRLSGKPPKSAGFAEFLAFFRDAGASLDGSVRWNKKLLWRLVRDEFDVRVCEAIARIDGESPSARLKAACEILNDFDGALEFVLSANFSAIPGRRRVLPLSSLSVATIRQFNRARSSGKDKNNNEYLQKKKRSLRRSH